MSPNKQTVSLYMKGFNEGDHLKILSCLTDDVRWIMPGFIDLTGKEAFDKEIENDNFVGRPVIDILRMVEENNIVIAEGSVRCEFKTGGILDALFCDVFQMREGKISQLTTYQVNRTQNYIE